MWGVGYLGHGHVCRGFVGWGGGGGLVNARWAGLDENCVHIIVIHNGRTKYMHDIYVHMLFLGH